MPTRYNKTVKAVVRTRPVRLQSGVVARERMPMPKPVPVERPKPPALPGKEAKPKKPKHEPNPDLNGVLNGQRKKGWTTSGR